MKSKCMSVLASIVVGAVGTTAAHAVQKHDPIFQTHYHAPPGVSDPNLVSLVRFQKGSPKAKEDLYVRGPGSHSGTDRDLVQEMRSQPGSPRAKSDRSFMLAPLK
jgi:hypothetical protein